MDLQETTALLQACTAGDVASVSRLLSEGRVHPVKVRDADGYTPLMKAVLSGNSRTVNFLLATDGVAQVPLQNKFGKTALHFAFRHGLASTAQILMHYDTGLRAMKLRDGESRTPCDEAGEAGYRKLAEELLGKRGAYLPDRGEVPALYRADEASLLVCWEDMAADEPPPKRTELADDVALCGYRLQAAQMQRDPAQAQGLRPSGWVTVAPCLPPSTTSFRVKGLAAATGYIFRLAASNAFGWGQWSQPSEVMLTRVVADAKGGGGSSISSSTASTFAGAASSPAPGQAASGGVGGGAAGSPPSVMFWGNSQLPAGSASASSSSSSGSGGGGGGGATPGGQAPTFGASARASPLPPPLPVSSILPYGSRRAAASGGASAKKLEPSAGGGGGAASDSDLRDDFLRTLQMDLEEQSSQRRALEGAVARYAASPGALEELSEEGLAALEGELEASLKAVRAAKERRMKEALGDEQSRIQCVVCLCKQKTSLFLPCKHLCACTDCAARILKGGAPGSKPVCPLCRAPVEQVLDVYA